MRPLSRLTLLFLAMAACGDPSTGARAPLFEPVVRDSADVRIVENPRPPSGSRLDWRVGTEPAVSIGELEGPDPYLLQWVRDALILPDGRIVVANTSTDELRVFDAQGRHLETWGGSGEGPGEFTSLSQVYRWREDSLIAMYSQGRRLSVFDSAGNFGRAFSLQRDDKFFLVEAVSPAGIILTSDLFMRGSLPEGLSRPEEHFRVRGAEAEMVASLGSFPGTEWFSYWSGTSGWGAEIPFAHRISAFAWGELVVVAPSDTYEIKAFALDGTLRRIVRREHEVVVSTTAHIEVEIELQVGQADEGEKEAVRQELRERYELVPLPETFPAFRTAMADLTGHLWVREFDLPGEDKPNPVWTIFDPDGRVLGFVETPAGLNIYEIGDDYILGIARDDMRVEYIQVWSLER